MPTTDLLDWLNEYSRENTIWFVKRLSANDTLATKAHQAGPYIPKDFLFKVFPTLGDETQRNPDVHFNAYIDSHCDHRLVRAVWYNSKLRKEGTRNESRVTGWGGSSSALLDPDATGAIAVFAFDLRKDQPGDVHVWVCNNAIEEDLIEERIGPVEPGSPIVWKPSVNPSTAFAHFTVASHGPMPCRLSPADMPPGWLTKFPSGIDIVRKAVERRKLDGLRPDERLLKRRECEFEIFLSVEEAIESPRISRGFSSVDEFVGHAQTVLQRRKARSGRSLELHTREILVEEGFIEGKTFSHQPESEAGKRPDFLFPSVNAYRDPDFSPSRLRLLAAKTTCKDRWRQVINEADRIPIKHLLTLQEGVSVNQFSEMRNAGIRLVIPQALVESFPEEIRGELTTMEEFIESVRHLDVVS